MPGQKRFPEIPDVWFKFVQALAFIEIPDPDFAFHEIFNRQFVDSASDYGSSFPLGDVISDRPQSSSHDPLTTPPPSGTTHPEAYSSPRRSFSNPPSLTPTCSIAITRLTAMPQHTFRSAFKLLKAKHTKWKRSLRKKFTWLKTKNNSHDLNTIIPKPEGYPIPTIRATRRFPIDDFSDSDSNSEGHRATKSSSPLDKSSSSNESSSSKVYDDVPPSCQTRNSSCSTSTWTSAPETGTGTETETDDSNVPERPERPEHEMPSTSGRFSSFRKSTCTASTRDSYVTAVSCLDSAEDEDEDEDEDEFNDEDKDNEVEDEDEDDEHEDEDEDEDENEDEDEDATEDEDNDEDDPGPELNGDESIQSDTSDTSFFESQDSQSDTYTTSASSLSCTC